MRLSYFMIVVLTGLVACNNGVVADSNADKTITSEHDQVLSDRELIDTGVNDNEKRLLRTAAKVETDSDDKEEERFSLIQTSNTPRYAIWFDEEMTPRDARIDLGLTGMWADVKVVKQSIYKGYVKYYNRRCGYEENSDKDFCINKEY
uniref:RxLR effector protein n=1 Tax=Phytophthora palmivora TaxID=4796 RepID=A0A1L5SAY7_9STRA|nr:REX1 [Phytophthora palmivora]